MTAMVAFVFSTTSAPLFREEGLKNEDVLEDLKMFSFQTEQEASAFCRGVDDAVGWEECAVNLVEPEVKIAQVAFGKEDSRKPRYKKVKFDSVAERIAYEEGVQAGEGWFDHAQVEDEQMENLVQALAAAQSAGKEPTPLNLLEYVKSVDEIEEDE